MDWRVPVDVRVWLRRGWAWVRLGGGAISVLGFKIITGIGKWGPGLWHRIQDLESAHDFWGLFGGNLPMLMSVATSPLFGIALVIAGLVWIPAAKTEADGYKIHPIWAVLGWSIFIVCSTVTFTSVFVGSYMNSSGEAEIRGFYIKQHTDRNLNDKQKSGLLRCFKKKAGALGEVTVGASAEPETTQFAKEFIDILDASGVRESPSNADHYPQDIRWVSTSDRGVYVSVKDEDHLSPRATTLMTCLKNNRIDAKYINFIGAQADLLMLSVAPR